jgi:hypothetical protein
VPGLGAGTDARAVTGVGPGPGPMSESGDGVFAFRSCFGDDDKVVTVVVAVRGRSADAFDIAAADEEGNFPVSSSLRIRDLRSSSSSHTVDGAVVDNVDSVPSSRALSTSSLERSVASEEDGGGGFVRVAERLDGR